MPAFQPWGLTSQHSRMPLTPPDYQPAYLTPMSGVSDQSFYSARAYPSRQHSQNGREFIDRYGHLPIYAAQQALTTQAQPRLRQDVSDYHKTLPSHQQCHTQYQYDMSNAPTLPPIRVTDDHITAQYAHGRPEPKQKEEKATGGVAAHLDYDMDLMAAFVAEMSQGIVSPSNKPSAQFRKYVAQILSSTRLPSSTIMLGMFYLASRMKLVAARGDDTSSSGTVYRMLTTSLLLGSKFLDDNTFQNRSWAEVSSIPVLELNTMELQWLEGFNWCIHGPMYDENEGFYVWIDHWHAYEKKAQMTKIKEMQKLSPIDTHMYRNNSAQQHVMMSPDGPIPPQYQQSTQFDTQWVRPYISEYSPPSAPHSGPATPDYYNGSWGYSQAPPAYSRSSWNSATGSAYSTQRSQPPSYHHTPSYHHQQSAQSVWTGHGSSCSCTSCVKHPEYYLNQNAYLMQPVAG